MTAVILAFLVALTLAITLIPAFMDFARKVGLVDHPDDKRKLHKTAIPMVGGLAIAFCVTTAVLGTCLFETRMPESFAAVSSAVSLLVPDSWMVPQLLISPLDFSQLLGLLLGSLVLLAVGLADDRFGIRGRQKLLGQLAAATVLVLFGYHFEKVTVAGVRIEFEVFSIFFVYAWVIASINSVNLLDGADGVAATIGVVMSVAMTVMMVSQGKIIDAVVAASVAGVLIGFLKYNFPPAKAYLGDAGSMLIGFLLAALSIRCTFKQNSAYAFFGPMVLLAIPLIDTAAAIIRRRMTGRSIFAVDRGHLHHSLAKRGYSPRVSLLWVALLTSTTAAGGAMAYLYRQAEIALTSIVIVLVVMIWCRLFGVGEIQLVTRKASLVARSLVKQTPGLRDDLLQSAVHVQGNRDWQAVWKQLCEFADHCKIDQLTLDVNAPWMHESFHATCKRSDLVSTEKNHEWFATVPLIASGKVFGRVEVNASPTCGLTHHQVVSQLLEVVAMIEQSMVETEEVVADTSDSPSDDPALCDTV